jgi:hypothetical protein
VQDGAAFRQHAAVVEHYGGDLADRVDGAEFRAGGVGGELADLDAAMRDAEVGEQQADFVDVAGGEEAVEGQHSPWFLSSQSRIVR